MNTVGMFKEALCARVTGGRSPRRSRLATFPISTFASRLPWFAALLAIGLYLLIYLWLAPRIFWAAPDFACFYRAGRMVLGGAGAQVYDLSAQQHFDTMLAPEVLRPGQHPTSLPFVFSPSSLLVLAPLSMLPYKSAEALWFGLNVAAMLALPLVVRRPLGLGDRTIAVALVVSPLFLPVTIAIMHGQPAPVLALSFALMFLSLERHRDRLAGMLLAASAWKPQFLLPVLIAVVVAKKWEALAGFAAASAALLAASIAQLGWRTVLVEFPQSVVTFTKLPLAKFGEHVEYMPNLRALWTAIFGSGVLARWATISSSITLLALLALVFRPRRRASLRLSFALLLIVTVLVSYHCYAHDATLLVVAALSLAGTTGESALGWWRIPVWVLTTAVFIAAYACPHSRSMLWMAALMLTLTAVLTVQIMTNRKLLGPHSSR